MEHTVKEVQAVLSTPMRTVVAETGWPRDGEVNGRAVPGLNEQRVAVKSIRNTFMFDPEDVILLSAYDDAWKAKGKATLLRA